MKLSFLEKGLFLFLKSLRDVSMLYRVIPNIKYFILFHLLPLYIIRPFFFSFALFSWVFVALAWLELIEMSLSRTLLAWMEYDFDDENDSTFCFSYLFFTASIFLYEPFDLTLNGSTFGFQLNILKSNILLP